MRMFSPQRIFVKCYDRYDHEDHGEHGRGVLYPCHRCRSLSRGVSVKAGDLQYDAEDLTSDTCGERFDESLEREDRRFAFFPRDSGVIVAYIVKYRRHDLPVYSSAYAHEKHVDKSTAKAAELHEAQHDHSRHSRDITDDERDTLIEHR